MVLSTLLGSATCTYEADGDTVTGAVSNTDNSITFTNQQFDLESVGLADAHLIRVWARRVVDAELALCCTPAARRAALEAYVRQTREVERIVRAGYKVGGVALTELLEAEFFRADAEALLAEEKARQAD